MIPRTLANEITTSMREMPAVTLTGPRQSGKTTLARNLFPGYRYLSMEDPFTREQFQDDPRSFVSIYNDHVIFDEAQRTPNLFSYLQGVIDVNNRPGQFVITGSQNFLLMRSISQSLAGRVAVRHLLPFAYSELADAGLAPENLSEWIIKGGYPRLYETTIRTSNYYRDYVETYVNRDVRTELGVRKLADFQHFLTLCAYQIGQTPQAMMLADKCGITRATAQDWLSILESSFILFRIMPYYNNYGKQLVKSPKVYFYDTGLASSLMGITGIDRLYDSPMKGHLFENAVACEIIKHFLMRGERPGLFYWRDNHGTEIDFLIERGGVPHYIIEVKSSTTYDPHAWATIDKLAERMDVDVEHRILIYGGNESMMTRHGHVITFTDIGHLVN